jgi:hypothetical protein
MVCNPCFHRWGYAQRLMHAAKVVVREVERRSRDVVLYFLGSRDFPSLTTGYEYHAGIGENRWRTLWSIQYHPGDGVYWSTRGPLPVLTFP